jgi:hypothetical protein
VIAHGFGFEETRKVELEGRDVKSLFGMVSRKQTLALIHYVPPFKPGIVLVLHLIYLFVTFSYLCPLFCGWHTRPNSKYIIQFIGFWRKL